jgi:hypothetical protein
MANGTLSLNQPQALGVTPPEPKMVPFLGGDVFNPADWIRVTNHDEHSVVGKGERAKKVIHGRFNGKDYVFPFGEPVNVHIEVARHLFGLGMDDKSAALARLGWVQSSEQYYEAIDRLKNIKFDDLPELMEATRFKSDSVAHASGLVKGDGTAGVAPATPKDPNAAR